LGPPADIGVYRGASGAIEPAFLWSQMEGLQPQLRFHADLPLPQWDQRLHAFLGRFDRDEAVSERAEQSGGIPRQFDGIDDEQTLLGLGYSGPPHRAGGWFSSSAGTSVALQPDPFAKANYNHVWPLPFASVISTKQTAFWEYREGFGFTSHLAFDRILQTDSAGDSQWLLRSSVALNISQDTHGLRGYANSSLYRKLGATRAVALQIGLDRESNTQVAIGTFGALVMYRQSVWRDWLILEVRSSLAWVRDLRTDPRTPDWGGGCALELLFGGGRPLGAL